VDESGTVQTLDEQKAEEITRGTAGPVYEYYGPLKSLCEQAAEKELPGRVLTVRPGLIVGAYDYTDRMSYWVRRVSEGGEVLAPGRPDRPVQFIDAKDLARWIIRMVETNVIGIFNAVGPDTTLTMNEFLEACIKGSQSNATFT